MGHISEPSEPWKAGGWAAVRGRPSPAGGQLCPAAGAGSPAHAASREAAQRAIGSPWSRRTGGGEVGRDCPGAGAGSGCWSLGAVCEVIFFFFKLPKGKWLAWKPNLLPLAGRAPGSLRPKRRGRHAVMCAPGGTGKRDDPPRAVPQAPLHSSSSSFSSPHPYHQASGATAPRVPSGLTQDPHHIQSFHL